MPFYAFECDKDLDGCGFVFEVQYEMSQISEVIVSCPECNKSECVHQNWSGQTSFGPDKTLGSQADRNNNEFSTEYKEHLLKESNRYPQTHYEGKLPKGGRILKRNEKGDLI